MGLLTKPTVEISPFFCLFSAPEIRIKSRIHLSHAFHFPIFLFFIFAAAIVPNFFISFPQHGNQKPGSPTFLCHWAVCLSCEHMLRSNLQGAVQIMPKDENGSNKSLVYAHRCSSASLAVFATIPLRAFWGPATSCSLASHPCIIVWHYRWYGAGVSFCRLTMIEEFKLTLALHLFPPTKQQSCLRSLCCKHSSTRSSKCQHCNVFFHIWKTC